VLKWRQNPLKQDSYYKLAKSILKKKKYNRKASLRDGYIIKKEENNKANEFFL
jgi:hypothetical protein